ncbi:MAG: hypothetical protein E7449_01090 [Ruminococcaceae bacterium]|nr:hypothetical protein [Oscillospiraceae bacterium]
MNRCETLTYIQKNYSISGEAGRLIDNVLQYAERIKERHDRYLFLQQMLGGTIGLSNNEIKRFLLEVPHGA